MDDSRFDHADGIDRLLQDFSESFGEKEFFRQGGAIREFEAMGRLQGESITAFVRRLRLLERKLLDSRVPTYPEQARVIKLLDGMRLDERSTSSLLLAAGNRYEMKPILDAIWPHYPAGMSVTGLPLRAAAASSRKVSQKQRSKRSWHTDWHDGAGEDEETYGPEANEVRATTACTFSTSQLPKVVREWCVLYILTWKCASRHSGVHFFDIATSKSGPTMVCFAHFDFKMCFAPQRRALFRHLNFQKWSAPLVFCPF